MMPVYHTEIEGEPVVLACLHWRNFPPWNEKVGKNRTSEEMRQAGVINDQDFQRACIWERICGKFSMDEGCKNCPMVRKMAIYEHKPVMMTLDGEEILPTTDVPTMEVLPKHRGNLYQSIHTRKSRMGGRK